MLSLERALDAAFAEGPSYFEMGSSSGLLPSSSSTGASGS